jgi:hypothetical protein
MRAIWEVDYSSSTSTIVIIGICVVCTTAVAVVCTKLGSRTPQEREPWKAFTPPPPHSNNFSGILPQHPAPPPQVNPVVPFPQPCPEHDIPTVVRSYSP